MRDIRARRIPELRPKRRRLLQASLSDVGSGRLNNGLLQVPRSLYKTGIHAYPLQLQGLWVTNRLHQNKNYMSPRLSEYACSLFNASVPLTPTLWCGQTYHGWQTVVS